MSELFWLSPFVRSADPEPILRDVFDGWSLSDGIFGYIATVAGDDLPWKDVETVDNSVLDISYFGNHSGGKFCSPLVKLVLDDEGVVPAAARTTIAKILISKYLTNWQRLWQTNVVSYSPINNYDMTETRDLFTTDDNVETVNDETSHTGTDTTQYGRVQSTQHGRSTDEINYQYGLNTTEYETNRSDQTTVEEGGATVLTNTGSDVNTPNLVDSTDRSTTQDNEGTEHEVTHRIGNIGVTTNQKLIEDERNLWLWNYFDQIFSDLDKELALAVHDPCRV